MPLGNLQKLVSKLEHDSSNLELKSCKSDLYIVGRGKLLVRE